MHADALPRYLVLMPSGARSGAFYKPIVASAVARAEADSPRLDRLASAGLLASARSHALRAVHIIVADLTGRGASTVPSQCVHRLQLMRKVLLAASRAMNANELISCFRLVYRSQCGV